MKKAQKNKELFNLTEGSTGRDLFGSAPMPRYGHFEMEAARRYVSNIFLQNPEAKNGVISDEIIKELGDLHAATLAHTLYALDPDLDEECLIQLIEHILVEMLTKTIGNYQGIKMWQEYAQKLNGVDANSRP